MKCHETPDAISCHRIAFLWNLVDADAQLLYKQVQSPGKEQIEEMIKEAADFEMLGLNEDLLYLHQLIPTIPFFAFRLLRPLPGTYVLTMSFLLHPAMLSLFFWLPPGSLVLRCFMKTRTQSDLL